MAASNNSDAYLKLQEAEKYFRRACEQIVQLNRKLEEMAKRYEKASKENHRSFRYSIRLRMAVTEGVRNMYYEYAANKADEITKLRCQVLNDADLVSSDDEDDDDDDDAIVNYSAEDDMDTNGSADDQVVFG